MSHVLLKRCTGCREYTLSDVCPRCGKKALPNRPAKFSPEDNYGEYRRRLKKLDASEKAAASATTGPPKPPIAPTASVSSVTSVDGRGKARRSTDATDATDFGVPPSAGSAKSADGSPKPTPSGKPAPKRA